MEIAWHPSDNFGDRRGGAKPSIIVIHYTAMQSAEEAIERLCSPEFEVSAHYVISRHGKITQLVDEQHRAWHAGVGNWAGIDDVNSFSIGVELDNDGTAPFSAPMMDALEALLPEIIARWNIDLENIIGHEDCAPGRKFDPGPKFDWARIRASLKGTS